jgi:chloramphenicol-sensitive protein RarD
MHRTVWSLVFVFGVLMARRQWSWMGAVLRQPRVLGALEGLALETLVLAPVAAIVLGWWAWQGEGTLVQGPAAAVGWLLLAGPLTAVPLLLFAAGARLIPMSTLGILQYISPSLQFALGVWLFQEPFQPARLVGFVLIWAALLVYSLEGWWTRRQVAAA